MDTKDYYRSTAIEWNDDQVYFIVTRADTWDKGKYLDCNAPYAEVLQLLSPDFWELADTFFGSDSLSVDETTIILDGHGFHHNADLDNLLTEYLGEWIDDDFDDDF